MSRKPVFHITDAREWRGGESQLALLARHVPRAAGDRCFVRSGSELANRLSGIKVETFGGAGFLHPAAALALRRAVRAEGSAIIHAQSSKATETGLLARAGSAARLVISRRTAFPVKSGWKYRAADAVIAVSRAAREHLLAAGVAEDRITIISDAVDGGMFDVRPERLGSGESETLVLCAAAFAAEKDHATLLRAWKHVEGATDQGRLVLAGTGPLRSEMERMSSALGLRRVLFLGWREDMASVIAGCDVGVLSSRSEGLASFLLEAQWCGKPVAATEAGGIPEAVDHGNTGLLAQTGDAEGLGGHILTLIRDAELRARMGRQAEQRARVLFAADRIAMMHEELYRSL